MSESGHRAGKKSPSSNSITWVTFTAWLLNIVGRQEERLDRGF